MSSEGNEFKTPTVNIRADHVPGGHIRIDASDFDSTKMELWTPPGGAAPAAPVVPAAPTAAAVAAAETVVAAALAEYEAAHPGTVPPAPAAPVAPTA